MLLQLVKAGNGEVETNIPLDPNHQVWCDLIVGIGRVVLGCAGLPRRKLLCVNPAHLRGDHFFGFFPFSSATGIVTSSVAANVTAVSASALPYSVVLPDAVNVTLVVDKMFP
jgi:hypothetical protein